jgi:hypothetical protein
MTMIKATTAEGRHDRGDGRRDGPGRFPGRGPQLSLEHVHRSRKEPGCISHAVHVDCENSLRLVFIEQWADRAALSIHFAVPASPISSARCNRSPQPVRRSRFMTSKRWKIFESVNA